MKLGRKIIFIVVTILVVLAGTVIALPYFFKDKIVEILKQEIQSNLNADLSFDPNVSVSLIKDFPNLTVRIHDISLTGRGIFDNDTLFQARMLGSVVNLKHFYQDDKLSIQSIYLASPRLKLLTKDSLSNWDVFLTSSDTSNGVTLATNFEKVLVDDGSFRYDDSLASIHVSFVDLNGRLNGLFANDIFDAKTSFKTGDAYISVDGIPYLNHIPVVADVLMNIDLKTDSYVFKENQFITGEMIIGAEGGIYLEENDDIRFDLKFESGKADLNSFLSLIPALYLSELPDYSASGNAKVDGTFIGIYSESSFPSYTFNTQLNNGELNYGSKHSLQNINLDLYVTNVDGQDNSLVVDLKNLAFVLNNEAYQAKLLMKTPVSNPYLEGMIKGKVKLKDIEEFLPSDLGLLMQGEILADLVCKGYISDLKADRLSKFHSSGYILASDLAYQSNELPNKLSLKQAEIRFDQNSVNIPTLAVTAGESDAMFSGSFTNFFGYIFNNESLEGKLRLNSNKFSWSDFSSSVATDSNSTEMSLIPIPGNLQLAIDGNIGELIYNNESWQNAVIQSHISNKVLIFDQLTTTYLGGNFSLTGSYNAESLSNAFVDMTLTAQNLQITNLFKSFKTIRLLAPIAEYAQGKISTTLKVKTQLMPDFSPNLARITSSGILDLANCDISGLKSLREIGSKINYEPMAESLKIKDLLMSFSIEDGTVTIAPFNLPIGETNIRIEGFSTLEKVINYTGLLTVPQKLYAQNVKSYNSYIPKNQLVNLETTEFSDLLFDIDILGTFLKPEVKLNFRNISKGIGETVKDRVKAEVDKSRKQAEDQARAELDRAKAEADRVKKEAEEEARKALEEEKRKLEERLSKEKEVARKKLEEEIKKKRGEILKKL